MSSLAEYSTYRRGWGGGAGSSGRSYFTGRVLSIRLILVEWECKHAVERS